MKPDTAIFELALKRFARRADQCLFIDDRSDNIAAGQAVGLAGHHFQDAAAFERELKALHLL